MARRGGTRSGCRPFIVERKAEHVRRLTSNLAPLVVAVAVLITLVIGPNLPAGAADNGSWSVSPTTEAGARPRPIFDYVLRPGLELTDSVTVVNKTAEELSFNIYAASAFNTDNGTFSARSRLDPKEGLAAWIDLDVDQLTLAPGTSAEVPFTIVVPIDAEPGDLAAGIIAENILTASETVDDGVNLDIVQSVGTRVYARTEGPVNPSLAVANFQIDVEEGVGSALGAAVDGVVTFTVVNTGNVRLTPTATLTLSPLFGSGPEFTPVALQELLPGGSATLEQPFEGVLPFGRLEATLDVEADDAAVSVGTSTAVVPWLLILVVVAIVVALVRRRRRRRVPQTSTAPESEYADA